MNTLHFTIEEDASPVCVVGRFDGQEHPGVFLPASTLVLLQQHMREALVDDQVTGPAHPELASLFDVLKQVLRAHASASHASADEDIRKTMRELEAFARELGGDDDGPRQA